MARHKINDNLVYNGDFEIVPTFVAATAGTAGAKWIDGTSTGITAEKGYGIAITNAAGVAGSQASFDTTKLYDGHPTLLLETLDTTGSVTCSTYRNATPKPNELFALLPSTQYRITATFETENVNTNGAFVDFRQYNSSLAAVNTASSTKKTGTNPMNTYSFLITTQATAVLGSLLIRLNAPGIAGQKMWVGKLMVEKVTPITREII